MPNALLTSDTQAIDTPPQTPQTQPRRAALRAADAPPMPSQPAVQEPSIESAPLTGVSERTLKSQSSTDTNPDWIFDQQEDSVSSHVSTPSVDIPNVRSATPNTNGVPVLPKSAARRNVPVVSAIQTTLPTLPCRELDQHWTPPAEGTRIPVQDWDTYSYASTDSTPSTPIRLPGGVQATPLSVRLVQTGTGQLSVVQPEHQSEEQVQNQVESTTTHLSMKDCVLHPARFDVLRKPDALVVLDLSSTGIDVLPPALQQCQTLEELNVSDNALSAMPQTWAPISSLHQLRVLLADDCSLHAVPDKISALRNLQVLGLRGNLLTHLPSWLHVLDRLECLLLEGNEHIVPAWRAILLPLLQTSMPYIHPEMDTKAPRESPVRTGESRKRGLLHKALQWSAPRRPNDKDTAPMSRWRASGRSHVDRPRRPEQTPSPSQFAAGQQQQETEGVSQRLSLRSLVAPISHTGPTSSAPLPPLGRPSAARALGAPASPPKASEKTVIPCFLPVHPVGGDEPATLVKSSGPYLQDLLGYLRDLDDLLPERHAPSPVTTPMRQPSSSLSTPRTPGTPGTPATPQMTSLSPYYFENVASVSPGETETSVESATVFSAPYATPEYERVKEDGSKRQKLIHEIVETERTYVAGLTELMEIYVKRARQPLEGSSSDERVLPVPKERAVFGHIEGIVHFHAHAFLPSLEQAAAPILQTQAALDAKTTADTAARVANVFTQHAAYFKMYMNYVNQYDSAVRRIARWSQPLPSRARTGLKPAMETAGVTLASLGQRLHLNANEADTLSPGRAGDEDWSSLSVARRRQIQTYLAKCREDPRHSQLNLEGYLLLPIQRIPRYRMLLEQLVRCTSSTLLPADDIEALPRALAHISLVASWVNEGKRQSEQGRRLLLWQSKLRGNFSAPLVQPHRRLVCDGPLRLRRVTRRAETEEFVEAGVLEQTTMDQRVQVLLCNDLAVVVAMPREASETDVTTPPTSSSDIEVQMPSLDPVEVDAVDLMAVLKPCVCLSPASHTVPPASVVGRVNLRVVDAKYIFYFTANSHRDAQRWAEAINAQPGG